METNKKRADEIGWEDIFPVLDGSIVDLYRSGSSEEERAEADSWFKVDRIVNPLPKSFSMILSASLFWKNVDVNTPERPTPTLELLKNPELGGDSIRSTYKIWDHYFKPIYAGCKKLADRQPDVGVVIWLANDLEFLADSFPSNCEVRVMGHSSIRGCPGMLWRLLALGEPRDFAVIDSDSLVGHESHLHMSSLRREREMRFWRSAGSQDLDAVHIIYRPVGGGVFGGEASAVPEIEDLVKAFIWMVSRGLVNDTVVSPESGESYPVFGTKWPGYGFDEWFLSCVLFPKMVREGCVSTIPIAPDCSLLPLDYEFAKNANAANLFFKF